MNIHRSRTDRHRGFSLIEIMIGLLLSLLLTGGVIQVYVSNKQTYYLQEEMSRLQENGRFALGILRRVVRSAGFQGNEPLVELNTADAGNPAIPYKPGNALIATSSNDHFEVVVSSWSDCMGPVAAVPPPDPVMVTNFFYVDNNNNLVCYSNAAAAPRILIENVEVMSVLYGVDGDGDRTADGYRRADQVRAEDSWSDIVSVRIGLLLGSSTDEVRSRIVRQEMAFNSIAEDPMLSVFDVNNQGDPMLFDSDDDGLPDRSVAADEDYRLYRVFSTTIALRNRIR